MNFLQITYQGNTLQHYLVTAGILLVSIFAARFAYRIVRQRIQADTKKIREQAEKDKLTYIYALSMYFIPIAGLLVAQRYLILHVKFSLWITIVISICGQVIFLLLLINILEYAMDITSNNQLRNILPDERVLRKKRLQYIKRTKGQTRLLSRLLLSVVPALSVLYFIGLVPGTAWVLPVILLLIILAIASRLLLVSPARSRDGRPDEMAVEARAPVKEVDEDTKREVAIRENVVSLFLNIYKLQLGAAAESPAEFCLVDTQASSRNYIYELRVRIAGDWMKRRMTIARLGEGGASRSTCFYVIYDGHLVVKVPYSQIRDLYEYIETIRRERRIIDKLSMKAAIVPNMTVILKLVHSFPDGGNLGPDELEARYLQWLWKFSNYQKYLKVADSFAFFMDLSQYYFLQDIVRMLHDSKNRVQQEILKHSEFLGDCSEFENRYGPENLSVLLAIQKLYARFETDARRLLRESAAPSALSQHEMRRLFFKRLAGSEEGETGASVGTELNVKLETLIEQLFCDNARAMNDYRETIEKSLLELTFQQSKPYVESITTNLLEFLLYLENKGVALRDLKPDNLLVAGDRDRYPYFLTSAEAYTIGVIDVETAVVLEKSGNTRIEQPLLGGTPHYATPSHFLTNDVLGNSFGDLSLILHLQDWHAVLVIIYKVATGGFLFERTMRLLPEIVETIKNSKWQVQQPAKFVADISRKFWSNALVEFREKMAARERLLRSLQVAVSARAKKMLENLVIREKQRVRKKIDDVVSSRNFFGGLKNHQFLLSSSAQMVRNLIKKLKNSEELFKSTQIDSVQVLAFLQEVEQLKLRLERQTDLLDLLERSKAVISAYELLELMFDIILRYMYREEWPPLLPECFTDPSRGDGDISYQATM